MADVSWAQLVSGPGQGRNLCKSGGFVTGELRAMPGDTVRICCHLVIVHHIGCILLFDQDGHSPTQAEAAFFFVDG